MEWGEDAHIANKTGHQSHTWGDVRAQLIRAHGGNARGRAARAHAALSTPQRDRQPRRKRGRCKPPRSQSDHRLQLATQRTRTPARARTCYIHRRRVNAWHRRRVRRGIADTHQHNATTHNNQCINTRADHRCHRPTTHPPRPRAPEHPSPPLTHHHHHATHHHLPTHTRATTHAPIRRPITPTYPPTRARLHPLVNTHANTQTYSHPAPVTRYAVVNARIARPSYTPIRTSASALRARKLASRAARRVATNSPSQRDDVHRGVRERADRFPKWEQHTTRNRPSTRARCAAQRARARRRRHDRRARATMTNSRRAIRNGAQRLGGRKYDLVYKKDKMPHARGWKDGDGVRAATWHRAPPVYIDRPTGTIERRRAIYTRGAGISLAKN